MKLSDIAQAFNPFSKAEAAFFGDDSATADEDKLMEAMAMQERGTPREEIIAKTGWFKGPDGDWRYEEPEPPGAYSRVEDLYDKGGSSAHKFHDIVDFPALKEAYPDIDPIVIYNSLKGTDDEGIEDRSLAGYTPQNKYNPYPMIRVKSPSRDASSRSMSHETQHIIQNKEDTPGFGSRPTPATIAKYSVNKSPEMKKYLSDKLGVEPTRENIRKNSGSLLHALYSLSPGEALARAAASRRNMTPEQRDETYPWESYDVPEGLIFPRDYK